MSRIPGWAGLGKLKIVTSLLMSRSSCLKTWWRENFIHCPNCVKMFVKEMLLMAIRCWNEGLHCLLVFCLFVFREMPFAGEGSEIMKLPTWPLLPQRSECRILKGACHCSLHAVHSFNMETLNLANVTAILKHLSGKICFPFHVSPMTGDSTQKSSHPREAVPG